MGMTSEERKAVRYERRVARRAARKAARCAKYTSFGEVFSYGHLYHSYRMCRRGVAWKASTQKYMTQAPLNVYTTYRQLMTGKFKSSGFFEFDLNERGKTRHIRSVTMQERVVQRTLCDYALVPVLGRTFIYDNGASTIMKGYSFAVRRLTQHLHEHYRKYGQEGYVLLYDFSKFFDRVSHRLAKATLRREFSDERLLALCDHFIDAFGDIGLGLGSQISQTLALASANRLDHFVKEVCRIRGYGRYMDDGYLIHPSKEYLHRCLEAIKAICEELEITLNVKKTQIVKLSHGFTWLKVRFFLTKTGRIVRKMHRSSITRMRRKMKAYVPLLDKGVMTHQDVYASWQSWRSYALQFNAHRTIREMGKLYNDLFIVRWRDQIAMA